MGRLTEQKSVVEIIYGRSRGIVMLTLVLCSCCTAQISSLVCRSNCPGNNKMQSKVIVNVMHTKHKRQVAIACLVEILLKVFFIAHLKVIHFR